VGSASALLGCIQIGLASLVSFGVGLFNASDAIPIVALMTITSSIALLIILRNKHSTTSVISLFKIVSV